MLLSSEHTASAVFVVLWQVFAAERKLFIPGVELITNQCARSDWSISYGLLYR